MSSEWVLVVEDDADVRETIVMLLELQGYDACGATDGLDALRQMRARGRPGIVLLDLRMPAMNGGELVAAVRADPDLAPAPIVVVSGDTNARDVASSIGAQGLLKKPFELTELVAVVRRFVPNGQRGQPGMPRT
jgi:CheY-like chemotaxis protein